MKKFYYLFHPLFLYSFLFLIFFAVHSAHAQESIPLTISPVKTEVSVQRGTQTSFDVTVVNRGSKTIRGSFRISDFTVVENGAPNFMDKNADTNRSASQWVSLSQDSAVIEPGNSSTTQVVVSAPPDAKAGGHYAAVLFQPGDFEQEGSTNVSVRVASLLNIKVEGMILEKARIMAIRTPFFLESGPVPITFSLLNQGDYHIVPRGEVKLINMFGSVVEEDQIESLNVFPGSIRKYDLSTGKSLLLGPYKAQISLSYGDGNNSLAEERNVFIFPWKLFLIVLLGFVILFYMGKGITGKKSPSEEPQNKDLAELRRVVKKRDV